MEICPDCGEIVRGMHHTCRCANTVDKEIKSLRTERDAFAAHVERLRDEYEFAEERITLVLAELLPQAKLKDAALQLNVLLSRMLSVKDDAATPATSLAEQDRESEARYFDKGMKCAAEIVVLKYSDDPEALIKYVAERYQASAAAHRSKSDE